MAAYNHFSVTPVPGDLISSSDLHRNQVFTCYTDLYPGKTPYTCMYIYIYLSAYMPIHMHMHIYVQHTLMYTYMYIHKHAYKCTYTYATKGLVR